MVRINDGHHPDNKVEQLAIEMEEIVLLMRPAAKERDLLLSKAKRIQELSSKSSQKSRRVEVDMVCQKCDLKMVEDAQQGRYRAFSCSGCQNRVGVIWGLSSRGPPPPENKIDYAPAD